MKLLVVKAMLHLFTAEIPVGFLHTYYRINLDYVPYFIQIDRQIFYNYMLLLMHLS